MWSRAVSCCFHADPHIERLSTIPAPHKYFDYLSIKSTVRPVLAPPVVLLQFVVGGDDDGGIGFLISGHAALAAARKNVVD